MGHAIPALLFTKEKVEVYLGSYGEGVNKPLVLGRLHMFFSLNLFNWKIGMARHKPIPGFWKNFFVILGGPIASSLIAGIFIFYIINNDLSQTSMALLSTFIIAAAGDFLVNMWPGDGAYQMHDGSALYSDGYQMKLLFQRRDLPASYFAVEKLYLEEKHEEVIQEGKDLLAFGLTKRPVYDLLVSSMITLGRHEEAIQTFMEMKKQHSLERNDFHVLGNLYIETKQYGEAMEALNQFVYLKHEDPVGLNTRGWIYLEQGDYTKAVKDFDAAIYYADNFAEAYTNRAFAKLQLDQLEDALSDIEMSKKLMPDNSFIPLAEGIYHEKKGENKTALALYLEAKEQGNKHHGLDWKISAIEGKIEKESDENE